MNDVKQMAVEVMDELHRTIPYDAYCTVMDGLQEIETLQERDEELEEMWASFTDVPMNPETECIEEKFMGWEPGTNREEIWHWFDERHSKGVAFLLYGEEAARRSTMAAYYESLCRDCETTGCAYNDACECRFPMVHHRVPIITDEDGCLEMASQI